MKKFALFTLSFMFAFNVFCQEKYFKELNYKNFEGEYYHEGGVGMRIVYDGNVFTIYDLMDGKIERVYIGYPEKGRIKYAIAGNRPEGNNKYEYIRFSLDYENLLLVGYWGYKYGKKGVRLRTKEITRSDLEFLSYYIGIWDGTQYPNIKSKCKIYLKDGHLYFQDMIRNTSCELHLSMGKKLFGELLYKEWSHPENFELSFDDENNLKFNSYNISITYKEVSEIE